MAELVALDIFGVVAELRSSRREGMRSVMWLLMKAYRTKAVSQLGVKTRRERTVNQNEHIEDIQSRARSFARGRQGAWDRRRRALRWVFFEQTLERPRDGHISRELEVRLSEWMGRTPYMLIAGKFTLHFCVSETAWVVLIKGESAVNERDDVYNPANQHSCREQRRDLTESVIPSVSIVPRQGYLVVRAGTLGVPPYGRTVHIG